MILQISLHILAGAPILLQSQGPPQSVVGRARLLTLEQTAKPGSIVSVDAAAPEWSFAPDGKHLVRGSGDAARWVDPRTWEESAPPEDVRREKEARRAALVAAFAAIDGVDEALAARIADAPARRSSDGKASVRELDGRLWYEREGSGARALTDAGAPLAELADVSPDGRAVAFVRANDLWLAEPESGAARALTSGGGDALRNGKLDWVYQEEIYGRGDFRAFWWSPDSARIAFLSLDVARVPLFPIVDDLGEGAEPRLELERYPKPGDPNALVRVGIVDARDGATRFVDLTRYAELEPLVVRVDWTPGGKALALMVQDRAQSRLDLVLADPATGAVRVLIEERSDTWVRRPPPARWLADGSFLWLSDAGGRRRLERREASGELRLVVAAGDWDVERVLEVDEARGLAWFAADGASALNEDAYRVGLDGSKLVRLTRGAGRHALRFSDDRALFLDECSDVARPPSVRLCDPEGAVLKELGSASIPARDEYVTSAWELHEVPARDGFLLDVALLKPVPFDAERSYPVLLPTYSGPNAPSVRNAWRGDAWHQFLAQQGVIVLQVNVRSASGKGHRTTSLCHGRLGEQELADLEDALRWLVAHPWADAARVGIAGRSYGGFVVGYALTHSDAFALGIAESGVYDWRLYDSVYTERYMGLLRDNPEGYAKSSVIESAADLRGHLVLIHGTLDDNVHAQNTLRLAYALQNAGKTFDLMLYPKSRHRVSDPELVWHRRQLEWRAIREHLKPPGPVAPAPSAR